MTESRNKLLLRNLEAYATVGLGPIGAHALATDGWTLIDLGGDFSSWCPPPIPADVLRVAVQKTPEALLERMEAIRAGARPLLSGPLLSFPLRGSPADVLTPTLIADSVLVDARRMTDAIRVLGYPHDEVRIFGSVQGTLGERPDCVLIDGPFWSFACMGIRPEDDDAAEVLRWP